MTDTAGTDTAGTDTAGTETVESLVLDLLEWVGPGTRPYGEVMEAWRTSCPRLPVWEEANRRGFLERRDDAARGPQVALSAAGRSHLDARRGGAGRPAQSLLSR